MFTVVIPLYNKELSIQATIQSVLNQNCQSFEIVVVNDGSTDSSAKIVAKIDDDRIRLIHQENQGVSAARNLGIKEARYEWIALLDGDDLWKTNHINECYNMIVKYPSSKVFATSFEYSDGRFIKKHCIKKEIYEIKNYFKEVINHTLIWSSAVIIHKDCFNQVGYFDIRLTHGEDVELWARLGRRYTIIKSSKCTSIYRVDAENRTSLCKEVERLHVYHFDLDSYESIEEKKYYKKLILNYMLQYFLHRDYHNFIELKNNHKQITFIHFLKYSSRTLSPLIIKKTLNKLKLSKFYKKWAVKK